MDTTLIIDQGIESDLNDILDQHEVGLAVIDDIPETEFTEDVLNSIIEPEDDNLNDMCDCHPDIDVRLIQKWSHAIAGSMTT